MIKELFYETIPVSKFDTKYFILDGYENITNKPSQNKKL